jgi:hypothetical protein
LLWKRFQLCFDTDKFPSEWCKANIVPVPKNVSLDPRIPLNYRGISCIYKMYGTVLNRRLMKFYEHEQLLFDEQNGFCENRSCQDHVFVLSKLVQNRLEEG